jgi:hypothetical protein
MADNGFGNLVLRLGYKVKIPSIFIKENDGNKLHDLLVDNQLNG